jgi:hypothetical protein
VPNPTAPFELNELTSIYNSANFRRLLEIHKAHLQEEANNLLFDQRSMEAYGVICRMRDVDKILGLIKQRIDELKPAKE